MEKIQTWGTALCGAAVAWSALQLLAPRSTMGKLLDMIGGLLFLVCVLSPLTQWRTTDGEMFPFTSSAAAAEETALQEQLCRRLEPAVQQAVEEQGGQALAAYGLAAEKMEAVMDIGEDGGIYITKIAVTLTREQGIRRTAVAQILRERFDVEVEVTVRE